MKTILKPILALILLTVALSGCTDAQWGDIATLGSRHRVILYDYTGKPIGAWISTGQVQPQAGGGFIFKDEKTGKYMEIYGIITSEQL